jgi:hypothetical protein
LCILKMPVSCKDKTHVWIWCSNNRNVLKYEQKISVPKRWPW